MKRIIQTIALGGAVFAIGAAVAMSPESNAQGNETTSFEWRTVNEALAEEAGSQKFILLDVYTDWCGWCKRMDRDTYADSSVSAYISERFVAAKMNPEKDGKVIYDGHEYSQAQFGKALGISGYPATAFFTPEKELITVVPGYLPAKDFRLLLQFLAEDHYKTTTFQEFKNAQS